mmetsp:Transcript_36715/g.96982  ORF Transcript_36715/g.96982 Transcript_36715/m.96982 type:complete len:97 (+) Transcript_36715:2047-2337(+)
MVVWWWPFVDAPSWLARRVGPRAERQIACPGRAVDVINDATNAVSRHSLLGVSDCLKAGDEEDCAVQALWWICAEGVVAVDRSPSVASRIAVWEGR